MVKCSNCGLDVSDDLENCPNCGNNLTKSQIKAEDEKNSVKSCKNCGATLNDDNSFCPSCGEKVEGDEFLKCKNCGSELSENTLFCSVCGTKVDIPKKEIIKICPKCGVEIDNDTTFCPECGSNIFTGENAIKAVSDNRSFMDRLNLNLIIKPSIVALIVSIILSLMGLLIGFSWLSFVIAIILSVGIFAAAIDNDANAIVFGLIVGLILGILETPLVEFMYGAFVAGFYEGFFGGHLVFLVILGVIIAYVSNVYLKENILKITDNFKGML